MSATIERGLATGLYRMKVAPAGLSDDQLLAFAHDVASKLGAPQTKGFVCKGDWSGTVTIDVTKVPANRCAAHLAAEGGDAEELIFLPFADPTLSVYYALKKIGAASERIESVRAVVAAFLAAGGSADAVRYWATHPFADELHPHAAFSKGMRFVLAEAARAGLAAPHISVVGPKGETWIDLAGEPEACPACRIAHRKGLCDDVRDVARPSKLAFGTSMKDGSGIMFTMIAKSCYVEASSLERLDELSAAWEKAAAEKWVW